MKESLPSGLFSFIWYFLKPYKVYIYISIFFSICAGLWGPLNGLIIKNIINNLNMTEKDNMSNVISSMFLLIISYIIFNGLSWRVISYVNYKISPSITNKVIKRMMMQVLFQPPSYINNHLSGGLSKQIFNLVDGIQQILTQNATDFIRCVSLLLFSFIFAYKVNQIFFTILLIWVIIFSLFSYYRSKKFVDLANNLASKESIVVGELVDSISNYQNVRIFGRQLSECERMNSYLEDQAKIYRSNELYAIIMHSVQNLLIAVMIALCSYFLFYLYRNNLITIGDFSLILSLSLEVGYMSWYTMSSVDLFNKSCGKCRQSLQSLLQDKIVQEIESAPELKVTKGKIEFRNVLFSYNRDSLMLFNNKSIIIEPGQKIGLVGYSGSGKSSFVNLIMRFYDVNEGEILIDGQNIKNVKLESIPKAISNIPQDSSLFNRSIMENIRYARLDATDEEVIEASIKSSAHEFVESMEEGYHSLVGEKGIKLSGGQRQRIAIARAFLKNAPILILDEATSQLDSITENSIQSALLNLMKGKTTIVIAHRLSTLLYMDRILVFDAGKIVEDGNHKELVPLNGTYKKLWDAQLNGFIVD